MSVHIASTTQSHTISLWGAQKHFGQKGNNECVLRNRLSESDQYSKETDFGQYTASAVF